MNEVQIDITITMGDTCQNTMSLDEAKALYQTLQGLFENTPKANHTVPYNSVDHTYSNPAPTKNIQNTEPNQTTNTGSEKKMPPPNLKVEAARQRAAERTSGCGSRR